MPYMKEDYRSLVHPEQIYAKAGERVSIINNRDGVLILVTDTGFRFPATSEYLTDEPISNEPAAIPPVEEKPPAAIRRPKRVKPASGPGPANQSPQSSLF